MNLSENISRIKQMMGLNESVSSNINHAIQESIKKLKFICENQNSDDDEYISFGACDLIDSLTKKVELVNVERENKIWNITLNVTYKSYTYLSDDTFIIELQDELKKIIGPNKIVIEEFNNIFQH
jgi:hypothetical protein